jgi:hypothetical protein
MSITEETALKIMSKEEQLAIERMAGEGCPNQPADDSGQRTEEMPNTRKVRIALAIDTSGRYIGYGRDEWNDKENRGEAVELLENSSNLSILCHFIEAEVPIPEQLEIKGVVINEDS